MENQESFLIKDGGDEDEIGVRDINYLNWQRQEHSLSMGNTGWNGKEEEYKA